MHVRRHPGGVIDRGGPKKRYEIHRRLGLDNESVDSVGVEEGGSLSVTTATPQMINHDF